MSDEFLTASRLLAGTLLAKLEGMGVPDDEITGVISAALLEVLAQRLGGVFPAVERLRLLADIAEAQELGSQPICN